MAHMKQEDRRENLEDYIGKMCKTIWVLERPQKILKAFYSNIKGYEDLFFTLETENGYKWNVDSSQVSEILQ